VADIVLLPRAEQDIEEIWFSIYLENQTAADDLVERLFQKFNLVASHPDIGSPRPNLGDGIRLLIEHPYVVPYRHQNGVVTIIRVLHGARDLFDALG